MNFLFHPITEDAVNKLMARNRTLACEGGADDQGFEV
jgi:hypothetical protein